MYSRLENQVPSHEEATECYGKVERHPSRALPLARLFQLLVARAHVLLREVRVLHQDVYLL
jgi:hypothetical protein